MSIENLIIELSKDPFNQVLNFKVAEEYKSLNQTASAVSFYLRTAEFGDDNLYKYTSLLKIANCIDDQNDRLNTVSNCILQAISLLPNRPEAYFYLSHFYEKQGKWQECYTYACVGMSHVVGNVSILPSTTDYIGPYCLEFEKYVSAWWIGRKKESTEGLTRLSTLKYLRDDYKASIQNNLKQIGATDVGI